MCTRWFPRFIRAFYYLPKLHQGAVAAEQGKDRAAKLPGEGGTAAAADPAAPPSTGGPGTTPGVVVPAMGAAVLPQTGQAPPVAPGPAAQQTPGGPPTPTGGQASAPEPSVRR
jgi:hypothetical protein